MSFTGNEGAFISLADGAALTANYRDGLMDPILGQFLGANKLQSLLSQTGCVGLRIYYAADGDTGEPKIVVVGVDSSQNDILATSPLILDTALPCPTYCGSSNDLNS